MHSAFYIASDFLWAALNGKFQFNPLVNWWLCAENTVLFLVISSYKHSIPVQSTGQLNIVHSIKIEEEKH